MMNKKGFVFGIMGMFFLVVCFIMTIMFFLSVSSINSKYDVCEDACLSVHEKYIGVEENSCVCSVNEYPIIKKDFHYYSVKTDKSSGG